MQAKVFLPVLFPVGMDFFAVFCYTDRSRLRNKLFYEVFHRAGLERSSIVPGFCWADFSACSPGGAGHPARQEALQKACGIAVLFIMALVGAIQDGVSRDCSTLAAVLDCVIIAVMTASLGKGCIFSAIPVFVLEGAVTLPAQLLTPTELAVSYLSLIGSILIFCVGSISSGASCCG